VSHEKVTVKSEVELRRYRDVRCDGCDAELEPAWGRERDEDGLWDGLDASGALAWFASGGYGMFIDPDDGPMSTFLFCKDCAYKLLDTFPLLRKLPEFGGVADSTNNHIPEGSATE
jgi:hypothetical protein